MWRLIVISTFMMPLSPAMAVPAELAKRIGQRWPSDRRSRPYLPALTRLGVFQDGGCDEVQRRTALTLVPQPRSAYQSPRPPGVRSRTCQTGHKRSMPRSLISLDRDG